MTSTLTAEDENAVAPALLKAMVSILDLLPLSYALNIETTSGEHYRYSRPTAIVRDTGPSTSRPLDPVEPPVRFETERGGMPDRDPHAGRRCRVVAAGR